ncbi:hypothetical protein HPB52_020627 [Rhipicephalus sanguineus]|uniref:Uncharacterized protein n=1 Tax=Rhipicephalus sanguineus TaxID=34632 RepID=A0A9D4T1L9_RHISA|nr:hypothetical protein HPB52_020627 [Rhipicephalus sanguineus]
MATLEDMSAMVTSLNKRITERKGRLAPAIKDLRPLRKTYQDVTMEYEKKKAAYDTCAAGLETTLTSLEQFEQCGQMPHSCRAKLGHEIAEQEKRGKALRERQKELREKQASLRAQTEQWTHLQALLRAKMAAVTASTQWHQGAPPPGSAAAHGDTNSRDWLVL